MQINTIRSTLNVFWLIENTQSYIRSPLPCPPTQTSQTPCPPIWTQAPHYFLECDPISSCRSSLAEEEDKLEECKWYSKEGKQTVNLLREDSKRVQGLLEAVLSEMKWLTFASNSHKSGEMCEIGQGFRL